MRSILAVLLAVLAAAADAKTRTLENWRGGILATAAHMRRIAEETKGKRLTREQKAEVRSAWASFLDYHLIFDAFGRGRREVDDASAAADSYAAFLAQYRAALLLIEAARDIRGTDALLNERVPSLGLPKGTFAKLKRRWLAPARATEHAALDSLYRLKGGPPATINEDEAAILRAGRAKGPAIPAEAARRIVRDAAFTAWFPVQKGIAEWLGDARLVNPPAFRITEEQIGRLAPLLRPGDILVTHRKWFVSSAGVPGFWSSGALYAGMPDERRRHLDDHEVRSWVRERGYRSGDLESFLYGHLTPAYMQHDAPVLERPPSHPQFLRLAYAARADSLAVLRPRASKRQKAIAVARAFASWAPGQHLDFRDEMPVCTELLAKAFAGAVELPVADPASCPTTAVNELVRAFDETYGTKAQQLDLVLFLDGYEGRQVAVEADVEEFRKSWKRPKWHILQ
jgi:hypothetical protein